MIFKETNLKGAFVIELEKREDERGFFARTWCKKEFEANGLETGLVQANLSLSRKAGTLRGMHYQAAPYEETKLVKCTNGALYDVIIDLLPNSPTYKQWFAVELTENNYKMLYVPKGFAHGFQTLVDNVAVFYFVTQFYSPSAERCVRWNDPQFGINWPDVNIRTISEKDKNWPDYAP